MMRARTKCAGSVFYSSFSCGLGINLFSLLIRLDPPRFAVKVIVKGV